MGRTVKTEHLLIDIDLIQIDDMPSESLREVFELCGRDVAVSLMEHQNGVFILMPARPFLKLERRLLLKEFDGSTASLRRIARKYCISEVVVREVLKRARIKIVEENQLNLFKKNVH